MRLPVARIALLAAIAFSAPLHAQPGDRRVFSVGPAKVDGARSVATLAELDTALPCVRGGDQVLLQAGQTLAGTLQLKVCDGAGQGTVTIRSFDPARPRDGGAVRNPATIDPAVSGAALRAEWQLADPSALPGAPRPEAGARLYRLGPLAFADIGEVFVGGQRMLVARLPFPTDPVEPAWLRTTAISATGAGCPESVCLTLPEATPAALLKSALTSVDVFGPVRAIVRNSPWSVGTSAVKSIDAEARVVRLAQAISGAGTPADILPRGGYGAILVNSPAFLDVPGEWMYDRKAKTLWMVAPENAPPTAARTAVVPRGTGAGAGTHLNAVVSLVADSNPPIVLELSNVTVAPGAGPGVRIRGLAEVRIAGLRVDRPALSGIIVRDVRGKALVTNSEIVEPADNGVQLLEVAEVTVRKVTVSSPGRVLNQRGFATEFNGIRATNFVSAEIADNVVRGSGYAGIMLSELAKGDSREDRFELKVMGNTIERFCLVLNDCAAIYINGRNKPDTVDTRARRITTRQVTSNRISGPVGQQAGTPGERPEDRETGSKHGADVRFVGAIYLDHQASGYDLADNEISGSYEPYGWRVNNKGRINACSRKSLDECKGGQSFQCIASRLDACNSVRTAK